MTPQKPGPPLERATAEEGGGQGTVELGDEISEMEHLDHGEMARVLLEELLLLVLCALGSALDLLWKAAGNIPGTATAAFVGPFEAFVFVRFDILLQLLSQ